MAEKDKEIGKLLQQISHLQVIKVREFYEQEQVHLVVQFCKFFLVYILYSAHIP